MQHSPLGGWLHLLVKLTISLALTIKAVGISLYL